MAAQGLHLAAQGLHLSAQGLYLAAQGLHLSAQGLYSAAQGLYIVYMDQMLYLASYWLPGGGPRFPRLEVFEGDLGGFWGSLTTTDCRHDIAE